LSVLPENRIVLAPLAGGGSTPELAAAVANAGGLPFLGAGYLTPSALQQHLTQARELTGAPLGVNLFVLTEQPVDEPALAAYADELQPDAAQRGVSLGQPRFDDDWFDEKLAIVLEAGAAVVSFTFGCPSRGDIDRAHAAGAEVWLTVTSLSEAKAAKAAGADVLVAQGAEAGGHRGAWTDADDGDVPTLELVRETAAAVGLPVVATGGIADRDGVRTALDAGAAAAQIGTAFLLAPEAGTSEPHRRALAAGGETAITRAFTGRRARGIVNAFMRVHPDAPSAYPHVHHLTAPLRAAARAAGDADGINLWAGTNAALARPEPAAQIVARLRP
jgi:nitronate monooxygenase